MKYIKSIYAILGYIIFSLLVLGDILTVFNPIFGKIATILWFSSFIYVFIFANKCWIDIIFHLIDHKSIFTFTILITWFIISAINIPLDKNLSGETTQQVNCALNYLSQSDDWGYGKSCFLGYPARQYLFLAIPSVVFGRSLVSLNAGASIVFLLGLIIFSGGMLKYLRYTKHGDLVTAILLGVLFHFYYVNNFVLLFDQSVLPFYLCLILVGIALYYFHNITNLPIYLIGLILLYLIYSYTPSLSLYFLAIAVSVYLVFSNIITGKKKLMLFIILLLSIISFCLSLTARTDIKFISDGSRSQEQLTNDMINSFRHFLFQKDGNPIISPVFSFVFIIIIALSMSFLFGWKIAFLSYWIVGVIILSVISKGFSYYGIDLRLQRASIIYPIFLAILAYLSNKLHLENKRRLLYISLLVILFSGLYFQKIMLDSREPHRHYQFIKWLSKNKIIKKDDNSNKNLYFLGDAGNNYISINDSMQYFIPKLSEKEYTFTDCKIDERTAGIFVIRLSDPCFTKMFDLGLEYFGEYKYKDDEFGVFEKELSENFKKTKMQYSIDGSESIFDSKFFAS